MLCRLAQVGEPTDCKLVQLMDMQGQANPVAVIITAQGTKHLVVNQVHARLFPGACSRQTWQRKLQRMATRGRQAFKEVSTDLQAKLRRLGVIPSVGPAQKLATLFSCTRAVQHMGLPAVLVKSFQGLQENQSTMLQDMPALMQQNGRGSTTPAALSFVTGAPVTMDPAAAPKLSPRERLSLAIIKPSLAKDAVLTMQLEALKAFSKMPIVIGRCRGQVQSVTWHSILQQIMLFLGYIHKHFFVAHPNLEHYTRQDFLLAFCCSKGHRGDRGGSIAQGIAVAKRVALYWQSRCPSDESKLQSLRVWLTELCRQVLHAWPSPKRRVEQLKMEGRWADAGSIVALLLQKKGSLDRSLQHASSLTHAQARDLHDVCLACTLFGWLPPVRAACVRTLCAVSHTGPCPHPDCRSSTCWGNRLCLQDSGALGLHLPHHKSVKTWGPIHLQVPSDLADLLVTYMAKGHQVLLDHHEMNHAYVFMAADGHAFDSSTFCLYWQDLMHEWGGPSCGPHTLRHIFVDNLQSASIPSFPSHQGAAYCMGHHVKEWARSYDLNALHRQAQEAVQAMAAWRQTVTSGMSDVVNIVHGAESPQQQIVHDDESNMNAEQHAQSSRSAGDSSLESCSTSSTSSVSFSDAEHASQDELSDDEIVLAMTDTDST